MITTAKKMQIVIAGGGFAGLGAAMYLDKTLARRPDIEVTFVAAGGGFAGVETIGALNDFVREAVRHYPELNETLIRVVLVHPGQWLLPELGEELGRYAERKLRERAVDVITGARVARYDGSVVELDNGTAIPAETLIWTAGVKPSPVIEPLRCQKLKGRLLVNEFLGVPDVPGLWAVGDSAAVPDGTTGNTHPPTAQHALREGRTAARNIEAIILGRPLTPFAYSMQGQLATIGRRTGVAMVFGLRFSGFVAWWLWRTVYVMKLPRLTKKLRVLASWTLHLLFGTRDRAAGQPARRRRCHAVARPNSGPGRTPRRASAPPHAMRIWPQ